MKSFLRLACIAGVLVAGRGLAIGPVGEYLGYHLNLQAVSQGFVHDSVHLGSPFNIDSAGEASVLDTTTLDSELVFHSMPGYLLHTRGWSDTFESSSYDTTYESTGVFLKRKQSFGDTSVYASQYMVPFSIGSWWRPGLEGTYFTPPDSTGAVDTIRVWADTAIVVAQETVSTAYGIVPDCWKIRLFSREVISAHYNGIPIRDSMTLEQFEWYKDSLWSVKDTTFSHGRIFAWVIEVGTVDFWGRTELVSLGPVGVAQRAERVFTSILRLSPNPFRSSCRIELTHDLSNARYEIIDRTGRRVAGGPIRRSLNWCAQGLESGVYMVRVLDGSGAVSALRAVLIR